MSIRSKAIALILTTMMVFLTCLFLVAEYVLMERFQTLESREAHNNIERVRNAIHLEFDFLKAKAADWIAWDDAYAFVQNGNNEFRAANLFDQNGANMKVNFLLYFNQEGEVVGSFAWDLEHEKPWPMPAEVLNFLQPGAHFLNHESADDIKAGFVSFPQGLAFVVSGPVVPGDKNGPIRGSMAIVKLLTPTMAAQLEELTKFKLKFLVRKPDPAADADWKRETQLTSGHTTVTHAVNDDLLEGLTLFDDWSGEPVMQLTVLFPREIMQQGRGTIQDILLALGGFGLLFSLMLILVLNKGVLNRVFRLAHDVGRIDLHHSIRTRVDDAGRDELSELAKAINRMLDAIARQHRNMEAILDHVPTGLLRCDAQGKIQSGYSQSCARILQPAGGEAPPSFAQQVIWDVLGLKGRDAESFRLFYQQIFDIEWLASDMLTNLPTRIQFGTRHLALEASLVRTETGAIDSILFSIADVTALIEAELENAQHLSLLRILRNRDRFRDLCQRLFDYDPQSGLMEGRRILHTWKGEFASFGIKGIASQIHQIEEDLRTIDGLPAHVKTIQDSVHQFLVRHAEILHLNPGELRKRMLSIDEQSLKDLDIQLQRASDLREVASVYKNFLEATLQEEAGKTFAFLRDSALELAMRLNKKVNVLVRGDQVRLPLQYGEVLHGLLHLIRNALDHGLEPPHERQGKSPLGTLSIEAQENLQDLTIIIRDDGRGIDPNLVKEAALAKGLCTEEKWALLSPEQQLEFVMLNGFSTHREVTAISGRGIGLDVVASSLKKYGGSMHIASQPGLGTTITIRLPRLASQHLTQAA
ncbi:MAG TPA: CHASE4 domain-containing protein [Oligoflexus sp.]|uniref:CHASE4 domain-containing protein n=1 Tax=Oligoflexus sp. TaxID=1971216 RepID=UPI002D7EB75A|nr:CHASE4 domain-containing protein [Oligoflexus sp.]HET9240683.1 CHASE4 domain-containing protein [Oligoflexus sp.]